ncbi:hypothetical protein P8452_26031 [Trifolium repens]|nr:hypothetical protein P8452_26031 [Trifolium repens]
MMCRRLWGNDNVSWCYNPALGRSGGLVTLWDSDRGKLLYSFQGQGFLGVVLEWGEKNIRCIVLNVYAPCNLEAKKQLWVDLIVARRTHMADLWCMLGDFNSVREATERRGAAYTHNRELSKIIKEDQRLFNVLIDNLELEDLKLFGRKFTWVQPNGACASRLDRILVSSNWKDTWGEVSLWALQRDVSDHCPLILKYSNVDWGPKPFRFNNHWLRHKRFKEVVATQWSKPVSAKWMGTIFKDKLKVVKEALKKWNKENFGEAENKITALIDTVEGLELKGEGGDLTEVEKAVRLECCDLLWSLLKCRDSIEFQRAKSKWLKEGDANTKFFHACVKNRSRRNSIIALKKDDMWLEEPSRIREEIVSHFTKHFSEEVWDRPTLDGLTFPTISEDEVELLCRPFEEVEIKDCIVNSDGNKSPGPDGFNFEFYKGCWEVVKEDLKRLFSEFHANAKLPRGLLSYFITLIPKVTNPHVINEFRPISLLGSVYKTVAKVLAARMGSVMEKLISKNQSAFIKGRQLVDGVLTVSEVVDLAKRAKRKCLIFKVDFEKAYDSVNWNFLEYMLVRFGFGCKWISWIKACVFAGDFSVLINGSPTHEVSISKGLKQGDPLAPFLFLLVAEGLGALMSRAVELNFFKPFVVKQGEAQISHLQYADDTLLIGDDSVENIWCMKAILRWFELMSGLKVNFSKSKLYGINVESGLLSVAAKFLNCLLGSMPFMYLGLPVGANPRKEETWKPVVESLKNRLFSWQNRYISFGGRVTLINSVLASLPIFYLSFMKMPVKVWKVLVSIQRNFLWGGASGKKKIAWVKWSDICRSKEKGGLGIRNLRLVNISLLAKWRWRLLSTPNEVWAQTLIAKYGKEGGLSSDLRRLENRKFASLWWKDICRLGEVNRADRVDWCRAVMIKKLGNSYKTSF